jgi:hypothetical protein
MEYSGISIVYSIRYNCIKRPIGTPRKHTIKCLTRGIELKGINNPDFAKDHLVDNPTQVEYRVFVI